MHFISKMHKIATIVEFLIRKSCQMKTKVPFFVKERTALFMLSSRAGRLLVYVFISSLCRGAERRHPGGVRQSLRKVSSDLRRYLIPTRVSNGLLFPD